MQLWAHFETFLKDAARGILAKPPHKQAATIEYYRRQFIKRVSWRRALDLIRRELRFSVFPEEYEIKEDYKKTWDLDLQFERHPQITNHKRISLWTRLMDSRTIRNTMIHEEGKVNGVPIKLTEDYVKFTFTFIKRIACHISLQWEKMLKEIS